MPQRFTRGEVGRILGLDSARLRYWERLKLVHPRARWGEKFYSFGDLVALQTIQRLTEHRIPAHRVRRAIKSMEQQLGTSPVPVQELCLLEQGRDVLVVPPGAPSPFRPLKQQWAFPFDSTARPEKVHSLSGQTPEELYQAALGWETRRDTLPIAADCYRQALALAPDWVEAHINLGVALYQMGQMPEARDEFLAAVRLDPSNGISCYNLGCVLEEQGQNDEAICYLRRAARLLPGYADVRFNLALAYEKRGQARLARQQWMLYLRYAPSGPWADHARVRLKRHSSRRKRVTIPFPRGA